MMKGKCQLTIVQAGSADAPQLRRDGKRSRDRRLFHDGRTFHRRFLRRYCLLRDETDHAPVPNGTARHLTPLLMPISRHMPICRRGFFGTASLTRQMPALSQALTSSRFNNLADFCRIEPRWECELPLFWGEGRGRSMQSAGNRLSLVMIQFTDVSVRFGDRQVLKNISM